MQNQPSKNTQDAKNTTRNVKITDIYLIGLIIRNKKSP
jgi:hypothetical protein